MSRNSKMSIKHQVCQVLVGYTLVEKLGMRQRSNNRNILQMNTLLNLTKGRDLTHSYDKDHYKSSRYKVQCSSSLTCPKFLWKNKTNHPISSNSHPSVTANRAILSFKWGEAGLKKTNGNILLTKYEAVHPTVVSENYSSLGMLTISINVQIVSTLSNNFAGKFTYIISKTTKWRV